MEVIGRYNRLEARTVNQFGTSGLLSIEQLNY